MAIFNFQKPDKVIMIDSTDFEGKFEFRPLEPCYGLTVCNALRRVLLSALEGYAITSVRIEGVDHEFSTISGVVEDVTEIILNLTQARFKRQIGDIEKGRGYVPAEENKKQNAAIGTIFTDSIFTPVKNVKYAIENFRVEQKTDYEKLVFEIKTDVSI